MNVWTWVLVLLGCAALALLLLRNTPTPGQSDSTATPASDDPDLYMRNAVISQFQHDGALKYELTSKQIRHFEDVGLTRLTAPDLHMQQTRNPPWSARADRGEIRLEAGLKGAREEVVHLRENVYLEQTRGERFISLTSDELFIYPDRQYAETDRAVMIDSNAGRTKAVGLTADLGRSVLNLASSETQRVHTIVLPHQFKP